MREVYRELGVDVTVWGVAGGGGAGRCPEGGPGLRKSVSWSVQEERRERG